MAGEINLWLILAAAFVAVASPGPATLAIANASMKAGRGYGLALASGVFTASLFWGVSAALGLGALLAANQAVFEVLRYAGSGYLLYLAFKSLRAALRAGPAPVHTDAPGSLRAAYMTGVAIHLTNPKAILFFSSLYAIGIPPDARPEALALVVFAVAAQGLVIFLGYALLFSLPGTMAVYARMRRWFEAAFAAIFGVIGLRILFASIR